MSTSVRTFSLSLLIALLQVGPSQSETYIVDPVHSSVDFHIRHLVSRSTGKFREFTGTISYDAAAPESSSFSGVIQAGSIDTGSERRDGHLKSADFFATEKYPEITFQSTGIAQIKGDIVTVKGKLTMHGAIRAIEIPVEVLGIGVHPKNGKSVAGFSAEFTIKRSDYGVNSWVDKAGVLGDDVKISLLIEALAQ